MAITRGSILAHLERGVRREFLKGMRSYQPMRSAFTREPTSDGAFEDYSDLGHAPWPNRNAGELGDAGTHGETGARKSGFMDSGGAIRVVGVGERAMRVYNVDWDIAIGLQHNAINDDRTGELMEWANGAGVNFEKHKDYLAFSALNSGDASTYGLAYDGQNFYSNTHSDPGAEYTTNQDNLYDLALSLDNFETVKVAASKFLDDRGQPMGFNHNLLIVPPDLERTAAQIADNMEAYDTANREINPYSGSVSTMVVPGGWFDSTAWVLVDTSQTQKPIALQMRQQPQLVQWDDETQGNGIRYMKWVARYNVFYGDWRLSIMGDS